MTNWYKAICHVHREVCTIFLRDGKGVRPCYPDDAQAANDFLDDHYTCSLQLSHDDTYEWPKDYKDRTPP